MYRELKMLFNKACSEFLAQQADFILSGVSEQALCGSLMGYIKTQMDTSQWAMYHVDVEYNRNDGKVKTILNRKHKEISITCDIIVHSRGQIPAQDNLLAFEMKRSTHPDAEKEKDKDRLRCLTKASFDGIWSADGHTIPKHVCGYVIGVYCEIDIGSREVKLRYYENGRQKSTTDVPF